MYDDEEQHLKHIAIIVQTDCHRTKDGFCKNAQLIVKDMQSYMELIIKAAKIRLLMGDARNYLADDAIIVFNAPIVFKIEPTHFDDGSLNQMFYQFVPKGFPFRINQFV